MLAPCMLFFIFGGYFFIGISPPSMYPYSSAHLSVCHGSVFSQLAQQQTMAAGSVGVGIFGADQAVLVPPMNLASRFQNRCWVFVIV